MATGGSPNAANVTAGNLTLTGPIPIQKEKYPLFFGEKGKDDIKISDLLDRLSAAQRANNKTDAQIVSGFMQLLRGSALVWWNGLDTVKTVDKNDWAEVQAAALSQFDPSTKDLAIVTCGNPKQKSNESVGDFFFRLACGYQRFCKARVPAPPARAQFTRAEVIEHAGNVCDVFFRGFFRDGMDPAIRDRIGMMQYQDTNAEILEAARKAEKLIQEKKGETSTDIKPGIAAIGEEDEEEKMI